MYRISITSQKKYSGIFLNKSISVYSITVAGVTKNSIWKSIEDNIENLFFSLIKQYFLAFNNILSVFFSSLKGHDR